MFKRMLIVLGVVGMLVSAASADILFSDDFTFDGANGTAIPTGVGQKWAPVVADPASRGAYARYYNNELFVGLDSSYAVNERENCVLATQNALPLYQSILNGVNPVTSLDMVSDGKTSGAADSTACWTRVVFRFSADTYIEMQYMDDARWSGTSFTDKGGPRIWVYKDGSSSYVRSHTYDGFYPESIHFDFTLSETAFNMHATTANGGADGETSATFNLSINHGLDLSTLADPKLEIGFREPKAVGYVGVGSYFDNVVVTGAVPEPATLVILAVGSALAFRRRK